ncbi:sugar transferase [Leuconostoc citreum]|uniref:sugar transferase n=1 Tax=Leuconostoc citreum TaxID=33964 RepID=UPI001887F80A|nr:sugar transferase [Leuconostoc citreum]MCT3078846.1 sugar transferase [Leuconostoc citreum]MCT3080190.1 sugar transferase [Leuconostoc citreum]MCT3082429.1 sugar transferase [Leuconostoc citreum]QOY97238.1 sugar transferase [Leuconostoc citreum]
MLYRKYIKRFLDLLFAISMAIILLLPLTLVALLVKITSKGPIFFRQERFGQNSKPFVLYKFRSMIYDAPIKSNSEFSDITSYVTPFGMFIRKTSIDELPQLINIIKGDMSFIGPRPLAITDDAVLRLRHMNGADQVKPGISGLAQVSGRNNITDEEKAEFDALYSKKIFFKFDFKLTLATIFLVLKRENIYKE